MVDEFVFLADSPLHIALHLSRGGESIVAPYIEKFCGIIVFGKFSCGTYVIGVFNFNIVVFQTCEIFFLIGSAIFSMVLSNSSIFLYGVPYTPSRSLILFFAHAYTSATRPALIV